MKKKLTTVLAVLSVIVLFAQSPQAFKYQAVARNNNGNFIQNQQVAFKIGIIHGGPADSLIYSERHTPVTNEYGIVNLEVGRGNVLSGVFSTIDWASGQMFMKVDLDPTGGDQYIAMGSMEILSVPFAMYADSSGRSTWNKVGNNISYNNGNVKIGAGPPNPSAILQLNSSNKGFLLPRMTSNQIALIANPVDGMLVYNVTDKRPYIFNDSTHMWCGVTLEATPHIAPWCYGKITDSRDFKEYDIIAIGWQCWMKENLNYGDQISTWETASDDGNVEKYCYLNDPDNCDEYGGWYHWNEIMNWSDPGDICPQGWRMPTDDDWCELATFLDPTVDCESIGSFTGTDAGSKLKEEGPSHWGSPNVATNESRFTALPGGYITGVGASNALGYRGNFWTSSYYGEVGGYSTFVYWKMQDDSPEIRRDYDYPAFGLSVRCIRGD